MTIEASKNKILIVCTTTSSLSSSTTSNPIEKISEKMSSESSTRTGADVKELAYIYHFLRQQTSSTSNVTVAAPESTSIPFDPTSRKASENDPIVKEFLQDTSAMQLFENPQTLDRINASEYSCVIFPGGPGCMFDLANTSTASALSKIVTTVYDKNEGTVAAIGHGLAALINVSPHATSTSSQRESWLKNRSVTCNTTEEEKDMQLDKALPFLLEQKLKEIGAKFQKGDKFQSYVVVDERLITGQNRNSVKEWMETVLKEVKKTTKKQ